MPPHQQQTQHLATDPSAAAAATAAATAAAAQLHPSIADTAAAIVPSVPAHASGPDGTAVAAPLSSGVSLATSTNNDGALLGAKSHQPQQLLYDDDDDTAMEIADSSPPSPAYDSTIDVPDNEVPLIDIDMTGTTTTDADAAAASAAAGGLLLPPPAAAPAPTPPPRAHSPVLVADSADELDVPAAGAPGEVVGGSEPFELSPTLSLSDDDTNDDDGNGALIVPLEQTTATQEEEELLRAVSPVRPPVIDEESEALPAASFFFTPPSSPRAEDSLEVPAFDLSASSSAAIEEKVGEEFKFEDDSGEESDAGSSSHSSNQHNSSSSEYSEPGQRRRRKKKAAAAATVTSRTTPKRTHTRSSTDARRRAGGGGGGGGRPRRESGFQPKPELLDFGERLYPQRELTPVFPLAKARFTRPLDAADAADWRAETALGAYEDDEDLVRPPLQPRSSSSSSEYGSSSSSSSSSPSPAISGIDPLDDFIVDDIGLRSKKPSRKRTGSSTAVRKRGSKTRGAARTTAARGGSYSGSSARRHSAPATRSVHRRRSTDDDETAGRNRAQKQKQKRHASMERELWRTEEEEEDKQVAALARSNERLFATSEFDQDDDAPQLIQTRLSFQAIPRTKVAPSVVPEPAPPPVFRLKEIVLHVLHVRLDHPALPEYAPSHVCVVLPPFPLPSEPEMSTLLKGLDLGEHVILFPSAADSTSQQHQPQQQAPCNIHSLISCIEQRLWTSAALRVQVGGVASPASEKCLDPEVVLTDLAPTLSKQSVQFLQTHRIVEIVFTHSFQLRVQEESTEKDPSLVPFTPPRPIHFAEQLLRIHKIDLQVRNLLFHTSVKYVLVQESYEVLSRSMVEREPHPTIMRLLSKGEDETRRKLEQQHQQKQQQQKQQQQLQRHAQHVLSEQHTASSGSQEDEEMLDLPQRLGATAAGAASSSNDGSRERLALHRVNPAFIRLTHPVQHITCQHLIPLLLALRYDDGSLHTLHLESSSLSDECAQTLQQVLTDTRLHVLVSPSPSTSLPLRQLTSLSLRGASFTPAAWRQLLPDLALLPRLEILDLSESSLGDECALALRTLLSHTQSTQLKELRLEGLEALSGQRGRGAESETDVAWTVASALVSSPTASSLSLARTSLSHDCLVHLFRALELYRPKLMHLNLDWIPSMMNTCLKSNVLFVDEQDQPLDMPDEPLPAATGAGSGEALDAAQLEVFDALADWCAPAPAHEQEEGEERGEEGPPDAPPLAPISLSLAGWRNNAQGHLFLALYQALTLPRSRLHQLSLKRVRLDETMKAHFAKLVSNRNRTGSSLDIEHD